MGLLGLGYSPHCYRGLVESHLVGADLKNEKLFQLMVALAFVSLPGILYHLVPLPFSALLEMAGSGGGGPGSRIRHIGIFMEPESDHWECLSVTHSLTHSLTH